MMQAMRRNAKFFLWIVLGAFILTIFALWGMQGAVGGGSNPEVIAKIGDEDITYTMLSAVWNNKREELYGEGIQVTEDLERMEKRKILDSLIDHRVRLKYASSLGITATDEEVGAQIRSYPVFSTQEGGFDRNAYINFLRANGIRPSDFENEQREQIILYKLRNQLMASVKTGTDELRELYLKRARSVKGEYVYFNYREHLPSININEEKMKDFYAMNKKKYEKPERVKASHILIMADASPSSPTGLTDEAAKKLADSLLEDLKKGASFSEAAKKHSADPGSKDKGGELGWFERGMMVKEFEDAAFALKKNTLSGAVKTQFGYHIIKCLDREDGFEPTYEKVRKDILEEMQKNEGVAAMLKKAVAFENVLKEGKSFAEAAAGAGAKIKQTAFFKEDGLKEIESEKFADEALNLNAGGITPVIQGDNGYYIFTLKEEKPAQYDRNRFEEQKERLVDMLKTAKFESYLAALTKSLRNGYKIEVFEDNLLN